MVSPSAVLFAASLHFAVQLPADRNLLGFLAVLSCIWMGASLGLLSIVDEREIIEHERLLFLNVGPYILAKTAVLFLGSLVQVAVFFPVLWVLHHWTSAELMVFGHWLCLGWLVLVSWAAVGLGMLLSAVSGTSQLTANFLLPLVMIAQIVFSVEIAGNRQSHVSEAYGAFSPLSAGFTHLAKASDPSAVAAYVPYLTISRYGDMAHRSFAYGEHAYETRDDAASRPWRREARIVLLALAMALPTVAGLWVQFWRLDDF